MTYTWIDIKQKKQLEKENINLFKENLFLKKEVEMLKKKLYPYSINKYPEILNIENKSNILNLSFCIGEYPDENGNHIILKEYEKDSIIQYKYYIDKISFRNKYHLEIIKSFFNDLLEKYGD